jgi:hypothetical protein
MTSEKKDDLFNEENQVANNWVTWGSEGDFIAGTLIAVREMVSKLPGQEGKKVPVYEIKADRGSFHQLDDKKNPIEPPVTIEALDIWNVGGKPIIDRQMKNLKLGTKLGIKYIETQPAKQKGFNPLKVLKVFVQRGKDNKPLMDEEWLAEREKEAEIENF